LLRQKFVVNITLC